MVRIFDYVIDSDERQFIVGKEGERKTKEGNMETYISNPKYFSGLEKAVSSVFMAMRRELVHEEENTLASLVERIEQLRQEFDDEVKNKMEGSNV